MQEHVKLEVSLEIIMAELAQGIFNMEKENIDTPKFDKLIEIQEKAYKADKESIDKILKGDL